MDDIPDLEDEDFSDSSSRTEIVKKPLNLPMVEVYFIDYKSKCFFFCTCLRTLRCPGYLVTPAIYPHLIDFTLKLNFCYESGSNLKAKNIYVVLPSFPIKIWGKLVKGFLNYDRTFKQTHRQAEITTF